MTTGVRHHVRRSIRGKIGGVRSYTRNIDVRLLRPFNERGEDVDPRVKRFYRFENRESPFTIAITKPSFPRTIFLMNGEELSDPDALSRVLSHETMHIALHDVGEPQASRAIDREPGPWSKQRLPVKQRLSEEGLKL